MNAVSAFFDRIAVRYADMARRQDSMYVFRAKLALDSMDLKGKVLDLGAGSGVLYDQLRERDSAIDYTAVDVSEAMIAESQIPKNQVIVTDINALPDLGQYDFIFALGLTTYLKKEAMEHLSEWLLTSLKPGGHVVITYTHEASWQWRMRRLLRRLPFLPKNTSLGSGLDLYTSTPERERFEGCSVKRRIGFNHFFNKRWSKEYLTGNVSSWYSDFLLHLRKTQ